MNMIYVAQCKKCSGQTIVPHASQDRLPDVNTVKFYCTGCGAVYDLERLVTLFVAL